MKKVLLFLFTLIPSLLFCQKMVLQQPSVDTTVHYKFGFHKISSPSIEGNFGGLGSLSQYFDASEVQHILGVSYSRTNFSSPSILGIGVSSNWGYIRYSKILVATFDPFVFPYLDKVEMSNIALSICPFLFYMDDPVTIFEIRALLELSVEKGSITVADSVAVPRPYVFHSVQGYTQKNKINGISHKVAKLGVRANFGFQNWGFMSVEVKYRLAKGVQFEIPGLEINPPKWEYVFGLSIPLRVFK